MRITNYVLVFCVAHATQLLQAQWSDSWNCNGPPKSINIFNITDIYAYTPGEEEVWPTFYENRALSNPIGYCGNSPELLYSECCVSSLDLTLTANYKSSQAVLLEDGSNLLDSIPKDANGAKYCYIQSSTLNITHTIFNQMYFLADGSCIDEMYKCTPDGGFYIYEKAECLGPYEEYLLDFSVTSNTSQILGEFTGEMMALTDAKNVHLWTTYTPFNRIIPNTTSIIDFLTHGCQIISITSIFTLLTYSLQRYRVKKQRIWLYFTILNLFRLIVNSIHIFYWYYIFEDWNTGYYVGFVYYSLSGLEYLFTVGLTAIQIFQLQVFKKYFWIKIGSLIILFILHVVLYGSNYFYICFSTEIQVCIPDTMYYEWGYLSPFWFITMFAWDLLPPILIPIALVQLSNRESLYKSLVTIFKLDRIYNITLIVHVWIIVIYFIIGMLSSSFIFQNDKVMFLMIHIRRTLVVVHEILTTVSVNQLKNIIPVLMNSAMGAASKQASTKSEQPSAKSTIKSAPLHG